jgi:hypothetical protein
MGITNLSKYISKYGGSDITNTYISIADNLITLKKVDEGKYSLETTFSLYLSKDARLTGKRVLSHIHITVELDGDEVKGNLHKKLYKALKKIYKQTRDD